MWRPPVVAIALGLTLTACLTEEVIEDLPPVDASDGGGGAECDVQVNTPNESDFNNQKFRDVVLPAVTAASCNGCHNVDGGPNAEQFAVWSNAVNDSCDLVRQFNEIVDSGLVDLTVDAEQNRLYSIMVDPNRVHPEKWAATDAEAVGVLDYIQEADHQLPTPYGWGGSRSASGGGGSAGLRGVRSHH